MLRGFLRIWAGALASAGVLFAATARAAEPACSSILVEADPAVRDHWPALRDRVRVAFQDRSDVDACACVRLGMAGGSITVEVSLPDGRSAARLAPVEDVIPMLEALLLVPRLVPIVVAAPIATATKQTATTEVHQVISSSGTGHGEPTTSAERPPSRFAVELSLAVSAHIGDGQTSESVGAASFLDLAGWLAGFQGRADRYSGTAGGDPPDGALEIGMLAGRRFRVRAVSLDLVAGPAIALRGMSRMATAPVGAGGMMRTVTESSSSNGLVPRLLFGGRLNLGARSVMRTFLGVDGELGASGPVPPGATRGLPSWTVGLALGVTVGSL